MSKKDLEVTNAKKGFNRRQFLTGATVGAGALVMSASFKGLVSPVSASSTSSTAWSFGVMSDTQWTGEGDDGWDPGTSAVEIARQIQQQFIAAGVKFVVHVGDLADSTGAGYEDVRALFAQSLYNANVGFFPLRGNHDDSAAAGTEFQNLYPQTQSGIHNQTPADVLSLVRTKANLGTSYSTALVADLTNNLGTPANTASTFPLGSGFSSPTVYNNGLKGLSYAFSYNNATFVLLDQFTPANGYSIDQTATINVQQPWINGVLSGRGTDHAFVFGHKGLITLNHADVLFGNTPSTNPAYTNAFISSLYSNNVKLYIHGHDHMHDRSIVLDTNGNDYVTQLLAASDSSKFYIPAGALSGVNGTAGKGNDDLYNVPAFGIRRRIPLSQELNLGASTKASPTSRDVGYYIVTVDGSNVTVDYYAATVAVTYSSGSEVVLTNGTANLPDRNSSNSFTKRETFGYGLNGKQFLVASGRAYTSVKDSYDVTTLNILAGTNSSTLTDAAGVKLTKAVNTGWQAQTSGTLSDIVTLWGLGSLANANPALTDTYVIQLTGDTSALGNIANGGAGLAALTSSGNWGNAVLQNTGGSGNFVNGPWNKSYGLGTYGVNGSSAWAVVNFQGTFAIAQGNQPS
jgi:hypothetical protein